MALSMLVVFCMPQGMHSAHAQHSNFHHGIAALAEKELRDKEDAEIAKKKIEEKEITARITAKRENDRISVNDQEWTYSDDDRD